ncbi:MAG TPA: organic hydroperoxide resistance protein [Arthrobacter sp.]|nr:organic hydroperoxide resistance protein [Arthrobacter sp.]
MNPLYTTSAISTGEGRNGRSRTNDGMLDVGLAVPTEMGGPGGATNPEQLFAAGYAACFHSALQGVARQQKADITDSAVTADVHMFKNDDGGFELAVNLSVEMAGVEQETAARLTAAAHKVCPYSHATQNNIDVTLETTTV